MSDFIPGGPEIPAPPFEVPTPDVPAADFVAIGQQVAQGAAKGGLLDQWAQKFLDILAQVVGIILAALVGLVEWVLAKLLAIVIRSLTSNEAQTNEIASIVVGGMTGQPVSASQFSNAQDRSARESVAVSLINTIQNALATGQGAGGAGGLTPSKAGAEAFLKLTSHMAIEGWLIGWMSDAFSVHELEHVGDLKDTLERALGLGRLARRALAPPMKILVEDPYTWLLNSAYRPAIPSVEILVRQYLRGITSREDLDRLAGYLGYSAQNIEALINFNKAHLSPGDIETLRLHGQLDDSTVATLLKAQGYDDATAASLQVALAAGRHDTWARLLVQEALVGLEKRYLTPADFDQYLSNSGLPADERGILTLYANLKLQFSRKRFSISEGETLVKKGLWTLDQFRQLAIELGYTLEDETDLELLLLGEIKDAADAASKKKAAADAKAAAAQAKAEAAKQKATTAAAASEAKGVSLAKFEALVLDGSKSIDQYKVFLQGKGIAADNIDALTQILQAKLDQATAAAAASPGLAAGAKAKHVDLSQLEAAALDGTISAAEYEQRITALGFAPADVQLLVGVLSNKLAVQKTKADAKAELAAKAKAKNVNLAEEQRGVRLGLVNVTEYSAFLNSLGFADDAAALLVGEIQAQLTADQAARATKASVAAGLKDKGLSLAQLEQTVRAGVSTLDDYRTALAKAGYDSNAQAQLVSLLELRMQNDQATLAAKGRAAALLGQTGLSLADIERAVKLGVIPITVYTDQLKKAGLASGDQQTLTLALAAASKATKAAAAAKAAAAKQLSDVGLSLAKLEADVLAGRFSVAQLASVLSGAGISANDQAAISTLISDEVANQAHLAQLEGKVNASAAQKGLSLADEKAAVKAGLKTIADYQAFLESLNYTPADVAILVSTFQASLKTTAPTVP